MPGCPQCGANTKAGTRCKRKTCKWAPKCHSHTSVEVRPSAISGRGLFAKNRIRAGEAVADYTMGKRISAAEFQAKKRAGNATHIALIRGQYYDAEDPSTTIAGMANRAPSGQRNNLKLTKTGKLRAPRAVPVGQELLLAYGPAFRL